MTCGASSTRRCRSWRWPASRGRGREALRALHDHAIVHRDVKPENLLCRREPEGQLRIRLIDLGLAKRVDHDSPAAARAGIAQTRAVGVHGSIGYMAPELLRRGAPLSPARDLWALGVVLWEALFGEHPYPDPPHAFGPGARQLRATPEWEARGRLTSGEDRGPLRPKLAELLDGILERSAAARLTTVAASHLAATALRRLAVHPPAPTAVERREAVITTDETRHPGLEVDASVP